MSESVAPHPATEKAWAWLRDNIETMEPEHAASIERILRNLDRELWELGPGSGLEAA